IGICLLNRKERDIQKYSFLMLLLMLCISYGPKDLHHYALITPIWALWSTVVAQHMRKWIIAPFVLSGILMCIHTDDILAQINVPTFNASQQKDLLHMLEQEKVQHLITMDYEVYGLLEYLNADIEIYHGWGAISHKRYRALPELISKAEHGHLIVLKSSMPMRYNLKPTVDMMTDAAQKKGLHIEVQNHNEQWMLVRVYKSATEER
ncbi:MAG: hypothetical protein CL916_01920, partial [Deltaproteobacteria bacterium]|nr:hypothetical protein [Deltaproteobacteria bacterium]